MKTLPTLYHKGKIGELRQWRSWSEGNTVYTEYGVVGGSLQTSSKICIPKNIGKSNATTVDSQAEYEAESLHIFKLARKYSLTPTEAQESLLLPMLAHKYDPKKHNGNYCGQPKLDGVRCIARWENDKVVLYSRSGKVYDVKHVSTELESFMNKDDVFDGELYIHDMPLQSQISLIKKPQKESIQLQYCVYDVPIVDGNDDLEFGERFFKRLVQLKGHQYIQPVKTVDFSMYDKKRFSFAVEQYLTEFVKEGYEGLILRGENSKYLWGYRSSDLLKVKTFIDSEFVVLDVEEGVGKMVGHAIVVCQNDLTNAIFRVAPKATMEERKNIFDNKQKYIGQKYTVKFFDRTEDKIPRFPVGLAFREDV